MRSKEKNMDLTSTENEAAKKAKKADTAKTVEHFLRMPVETIPIRMPVEMLQIIWSRCIWEMMGRLFQMDMDILTRIQELIS